MQLYSPDDGSELYLGDDGYYHSDSNSYVYEIFNGSPVRIAEDGVIDPFEGNGSFYDDKSTEKSITKKRVVESVLLYLKQIINGEVPEVERESPLLIDKIKYFAELEQKRLLGSSKEETESEFNEYLELIKEVYEEEDLHDESVFSCFEIYGSSCVHRLEKINGDNSELILYGAFKYDSDFKNKLLIPAVISFAKRNPVNSVEVSPNPRKTSLYNVIAYASDHNLINIDNLEEDFAREIAHNIGKIPPVHFSKKNKKNYSMGFVGIAELCILTFAITFVIGVVLAIQIMN